MKKKYFIILFLLLVFDQISKYIIASNFNLYEKMIIINNFLKLEYIQNTGISFGLFSGNGIIIIIASLLIIGFMIYDMSKNESNIHKICCTLILSGAIGNLIDRIFRGYVVDFISFTLFNHQMAVFNIADVCIVIGVLLYIFLMFVEGKKENGKNNSK
jgi:signal peptidase II